MWWNGDPKSSRLKSFAFDWEIDEKRMIFTNRTEINVAGNLELQRKILGTRGNISQYWGWNVSFLVYKNQKKIIPKKKKKKPKKERSSFHEVSAVQSLWSLQPSTMVSVHTWESGSGRISNSTDHIPCNTSNPSHLFNLKA